MTWDCIVVGGGPAGATAATVMALDGRRVLLLEKEHFPRYKVGESLLPATVHGIANLLGVREALQEAGFVKKVGGSFLWGSNPEMWTFAFADQVAVCGANYAYQVERSRFDDILLRNAAAKGVEVRQGVHVQRAVREGQRFVGVAYTGPEGERVARARYVVDASGSRSFIAREMGHRAYDSFFKNLAIFGYFDGGRRLDAPNDGNVLSVAFPHGWFWYIPLSGGLTSVGAVVPTDKADLLKGRDRPGTLRALIGGCRTIREMLADAQPATQPPYDEVRILRDFSYRHDRYYEDGAALIGDAACFIDPLFSSGVHLATFSGLMVARAVNSCLAGEADEAAAFTEFERRYRREVAAFYQFLVAFYDIHEDDDSAYWSQRKIAAAAEVDREGFGELVCGLQGAESRFADTEAFIRSTADEARVLQRAAMLTSNWSARDPDLARVAAPHVASLSRERRELLGVGPQAPVFEGGLIPSASLLRFETPKTKQ